jgi:hypothetical protein
MPTLAPHIRLQMSAVQRWSRAALNLPESATVLVQEQNTSDSLHPTITLITAPLRCCVSRFVLSKPLADLTEADIRAALSVPHHH